MFNIFKRAPKVSDLEQVISLAEPDILAALSEVKAAHPGEEFYAYALTNYTSFEGMGFHLMGERALAALMERHAKTIAEAPPEHHIRSYFRWYWGEWGRGYEFAGGPGRLKAANDWARQRLQEGDNSPEIREMLMKAMAMILARLDEAGHFGQGEDRAKVLIYSGFYDSGTEWCRQSAEMLNPPEIWAKHKADFCAGLGC